MRQIVIIAADVVLVPGRACTFGLPGSQMPPDDNAASLGLSILDSRTIWIVNSETSDKLA
jgi:hypothetical protein